MSSNESELSDTELFAMQIAIRAILEELRGKPGGSIADSKLTNQANALAKAGTDIEAGIAVQIRKLQKSI